MGPGLHRQCEARWQNPLSARRASCPFRRLKHLPATPTANPTPTPSTIGSTGPALATRLPARASTWQTPVLATWVICSQNRHLQLDLTSPLLAEKREMSVQSTTFALPHALTTHPFSRRRSSSSVSCLHLHQTPGLFLLSHPPRWLFALDKTAQYFLAARSAGRSCQREIRTGRGKCALTPTTHHPSSTEQTTSVQ